MQLPARGHTACNWQLNSYLGVSTAELQVLPSLAVAVNKACLERIKWDNIRPFPGTYIYWRWVAAVMTKIASRPKFIASVRIWLKSLRYTAKTAIITWVSGTQLLQCLFHSGKLYLDQVLVTWHFRKWFPTPTIFLLTPCKCGVQLLLLLLPCCYYFFKSIFTLFLCPETAHTKDSSFKTKCHHYLILTE